MYSRFGAGFAAKSGTRQLMDDLGEVARGGADLINLGGGNPALIPALQAQFEAAWAAVPTREWLRILSGYDAPQGHQVSPTTSASVAHLRARLQASA